MKILILEWNSVNGDAYNIALKKMNLDVDTEYLGEIRKIKTDIDFVYNKCVKKLKSNHYDCAFSINFIAGIAEACHEYGIPYIAWTYDSPAGLGGVFEKYVRYDTSYTFLFDSSEVELMNKYHLIDNVYYCPLGVDINRFNNVISTVSGNKYKGDISFVGSLYSNDLGNISSKLNDYQKGFINALVDVIAVTNDFNYLNNIITENFIEWLNNDEFIDYIMEEASFINFRGDKREEASVLRTLINRNATNRMRLLIISLLSNHFELNLYSRNTNQILSKANNCGGVDYHNEMPMVFFNSKINLNMTFKTIQTGIPQRCLDIMGCGGFLLTNHQKDFDEHFVEGTNIAYFNDEIDAYEKCKFYLANDEIRQKIAYAGYNTIAKYYTYEAAFSRIFNIVGLEV